ncbi:hypothetical protein ACS0TY_024441 [Phlomoides rotata]
MSRLSNMNFSPFFVFYLFFSYSFYAHANNLNSEQKQLQLQVPIGVVLDLNSTFGAMINSCMNIAISDFYSAHSNYKTRLQLYKKDAKSVLDVNFAVVEFVKHEEVVAILGAEGSIEKTYASALGESVLVPIVSFTERSSAAKNRYFVRTTIDDATQAQALAAICVGFEWPEVVIFYEESSPFLSHLINAFQDVDIAMTYMISIPASAEDSNILKKLNKTKMKQTRVFLVHMNPVLGGRLFSLANTAGMMSEGYAWIITDSLSIFLSSIDSEARESMDGVLGIRPYIFPSRDLQSFQERWKREMQVVELNIYGLWAYDAVTALAIAVENIRPPMDVNGTGFRNSSFGSRLVNELSNTRFRGLAGDFQLVEGKLKFSALEIFNVIGNGERRVGFWTPERGITRVLSAPGEPTTKGLKKVFWPGDTVTKPKGRTFLKTESLRIGVPFKTGFTEFVNVTIDPTTNITHASGFVIDIFLEVWEMLNLPTKYTFHLYNGSKSGNWTYGDMLHRIPEEYDMVVGDTTIWAPRASYVDFSLPYSESGVVLVVKNKKPFDMWIFVRPLRWDLWLAIIVSCIFMGLVLCILERGVARSRSGDGSARPGVGFWSPISILAFQERDIVSNNWSVFVLVCWLFMAYILMQSFTANLSAILTVDQLKFSFSEGYHVGYQGVSFIKDFLVENLSINESRLRPYSSIQGFHDAMTRGSKNGGIDVIFDELPYMKLFLNRYESQYKIVGPTYRTDGLGFAFPTDSPLVACFSRAILNVTQGPKMDSLERKRFGPGYSSHDPLSSIISQGTSSLALHEFAGLFLLTGSFILFALFCSETVIGQKITRYFVQICFTFGHPRVHSMESSHGGGDESHEHAQDDVNPGEGGDAEEIVETGLDNETSTTQEAGVAAHT